MLITIVMTLMSGCTGNTEEYPTIQDKLAAMKSYKTNAEISYISNKGTTVYDSIINAKADGKYRIDITAPEEYKGCVIMYDGKLVWHYNPHLENNKISANPPDKASRREIILFSFLENYQKSMDTTAEAAASQNTILETTIPGDIPLLNKEKLIIDNKEMLPVSLIISDKENNERIVVKFSGFEYNNKTDDSIFTIQ